MPTFYHSSRPRMGSQPLSPEYLGQDGTGQGFVLPGLRLRPEPDGSWEFSACLPSEWNSASWLEGRARNLEQVAEWLGLYFSDPEEALRQIFGYHGPEGRGKVTLDGLGLGLESGVPKAPISLASLGLGLPQEE